MKYLLALLLVVPAFGMFIRDPEWHLWKKTHLKSYVNNEEEHYRYGVWSDNKRQIEEHNKVHPFALSMNHFGDLSLVEFSRTMNGYMGKMNFNQSRGATFLAPSNVNLPDTVDWRTKGYVTPVKNQGQCGSCWAFSTTGSLEGQHFKKTGKMVSLSEQNLVDCSRKFGNMGCEGGLMDNAFRYIKSNDGIDTETSYPYKAVDGTCHFVASEVGADDTGYVDVKAGDESALKTASATIGPISVAIDASHLSFQFYHNKVYNEPSCSSTRLDHGVLVVGYGTEDGQDYWLVKNSWGAGWGINGYIKMSRNKNNQCGIASKASYPLV